MSFPARQRRDGSQPQGPRGVTDTGLRCWGSCSHVPPLPGWFCSGSRALCWDKWAFSCPSLSWALTDGLNASRLFYPPCLFLGFSLCILFPASFPFRSRCNRHKRREREVLRSWEQRGFSCYCWYLCSMDFKLKPCYFPLEASV